MENQLQEAGLRRASAKALILMVILGTYIATQ